MSRSVIVSAVRTPFGKLGGGLAGHQATELGSIVIRAALERIGLEADEPRVHDHGPGAPGRRRPGARAPGRDRRRAAEGDAGRHDQQGLRLLDPRRPDRRRDDPRRRRRGDRHRRDGVDVERAVPAQEGPLRLPARPRRAARLDDLRRAHRRLRPAAHGPAQLARLARARDQPRGAGRVGAPLAAARGRRAGRGTLRGRDRRRSATSTADEAHPPRHDRSSRSRS